MHQDTTSSAPADHRKLAVDLFNHTWTLLRKPDRSHEEEDEMIHSAHASAYHWLVAGEPVNWARSHWQCARVYAALDRAEPALHHAMRCKAIAHEFDLSTFDKAIAHEATARALAAAGQGDAARIELAAARTVAATCEDDQERAVVEDDCRVVEAVLQ